MFQLDNKSNETLPILKDGAMSTITMRRKPKIKVLDILGSKYFLMIVDRYNDSCCSTVIN